MNVYELTPATIPSVAHLMCTIKPDWWDYEGAYEQLSNVDATIKIRSGISSVGFNIHHQEIKNIPETIEGLTCDRIDYKWYLQNGFRVIGIQPNAYERGFHLIMLGKELVL